MTLSVSQNFTKGWTSVATGTGVVSNTPDGKILSTISNGTNNGAMKEWYFQVSPGDTIEVSVWARAVTGVPRISVDCRDSNNVNMKTVVYEEIKGSEFKRYKLKAVVPEYLQNISCAALVLGGWNSNPDATEGYFMEPSISVESKNYGFLQPIAYGMLRMSNGVPDVHPGFKNKGITSVTFETGTNELVITIESSIINGARPIMLATGTPDHNESVVAGKFSVNTFRVAFTSGAAKINISTGTWYANVMVMY